MILHNRGFVNARLEFITPLCYACHMVKKGFLITNGFIKSGKFEALYASLSAAAAKCSLSLEACTNIDLMSDAALNITLKNMELPPFSVFWDKDIRLMQLLEDRGMRLFNSADAVEKCDDKSLTHIALSGRLPMPRTVLIPLTFPRVGYTDTSFLETVADYLGFPFVIKECFGSFGAQVYLARDIGEAKALLQKTAGSAAIAQEFIREAAGRDMRLYVVGGRCAAAMERENTAGDFRANVALGGRTSAYRPTEDEKQLAERAAALLGLDFAGVDLLRAKDGPVLCEVNSNAHFAGISEATGVDIALLIMAHVAEAVNARQAE